MYVLGGSGGSNSVWSSSDGATWSQVAATAEWSGRYGHGSVVLDNKIYVMGGMGGGMFLNDVWSSSDGGSTWVVVGTAAWNGRRQFPCIVYENKIVVFAGYANAYYHDVWYLEPPLSTVIVPVSNVTNAVKTGVIAGWVALNAGLLGYGVLNYHGN